MISIGKRQAVKVAHQAAEKLGLDSSKGRPHELLLFAKLDADENSYTFRLKHEDAIGVLPIAKGLLDRDAFLAVGMAVGIVPVPIRSGSERPRAAAPVYFPDPNIFAEAAAGAGNDLSESEALESIYWGDVTIQTNEGVRIDKMPLLDFRTVQQTQGSASTQNMQTGLEVKELGAVVRFGGGDENEIRIKIVSSDKTHLAGTAARANYIMIRLVGSIIKGSTTSQYLK